MTANLVDFRAYAAARGYVAPALASDVDADAALVRGSDYVMLEYVARFIDGCDENSPGVDEAVYEAARMELTDAGALLTSSFWDATYTPGQQKVLTEVKGIKWQVLDAGDDSRTIPISTRIEALLRSCTRPTYNGQGIGMWALG